MDNYIDLTEQMTSMSYKFVPQTFFGTQTDICSKTSTKKTKKIFMQKINENIKQNNTRLVGWRFAFEFNVI